MKITKKNFQKAWDDNKDTVALVTIAGGVLKVNDLLAKGDVEEAMEGLQRLDRAAVAAIRHHADNGVGFVKEMANDIRERALRESAAGSSTSGAESSGEGSFTGTRE